MSNKADFTAEYVRSILNYDPETGVFTWRVRPREQFKTQQACSRWNTVFAGKIAGTVTLKGCSDICIGNSVYKAHRLAWLYTTGAWPNAFIDHIDGDPLNNRFVNLREATNAENMRNRGATSINKSGRKGVSLHRETGKWQATIKVEGKVIYLGLYSSVEEASRVYEKAALEHHGEFARIA